MSRRRDASIIKTDDISTRNLTDWDQKVERAANNENSWKFCLMGAVGIIAVQSGYIIYQSSQIHTTVTHIVHDSIGRVISVSADNDGSGLPTQAMLQRDIEDWIGDARTVGVDTKALKNGILRAYNQVDKGTQARTDLDTFFLNHDRFDLAKDKTVTISNRVAIPPTASDIGAERMQTWGVSWTEHVESRDGQSSYDEFWTGNVTFTVKRWGKDTQQDDVLKNPNGVHIQSYSWIQR